MRAVIQTLRSLCGRAVVQSAFSETATNSFGWGHSTAKILAQQSADSIPVRFQKLWEQKTARIGRSNKVRDEKVAWRRLTLSPT